MSKIEFYEDTANEWRWRVRAANNKILGASTEGYSQREYAKNNLQSLPKYARGVDIRIAAKYARDMDVRTAAKVPSTRPEGRQHPLEFYRDAKGEWRWRVIARNGQLVHASSEGFSDRQGARKNLERLAKAIADQDGGLV